MFYQTLDAVSLDLGGLAPDQMEHLKRCHTALMRGISSADMRLLTGISSPWRDTDLYKTPYFQAVQDLLRRVDIENGLLSRLPGDDPDRDPFVDAPQPPAAPEPAVTAGGDDLRAELGGLRRKPVPRTRVEHTLMSAEKLEALKSRYLREFRPQSWADAMWWSVNADALAMMSHIIAQDALIQELRDSPH